MKHLIPMISAALLILSACQEQQSPAPELEPETLLYIVDLEAEKAKMDADPVLRAGTYLMCMDQVAQDIATTTFSQQDDLASASVESVKDGLAANHSCASAAECMFDTLADRSAKLNKTVLSDDTLTNDMNPVLKARLEAAEGLPDGAIRGAFARLGDEYLVNRLANLQQTGPQFPDKQPSDYGICGILAE